MKRTWLCLILCCLGAMSGFAQKHTTFEMRYFSKDAKANGETDLHGDTETMSLEERVSALGKYAGYAARFWGDPQLHTSPQSRSSPPPAYAPPSAWTDGRHMVTRKAKSPSRLQDGRNGKTRELS